MMDTKTSPKPRQGAPMNQAAPSADTAASQTRSAALGAAAAHMPGSAWPRILYSALVRALLPLVALYLLWRSVRQPDYRRFWTERFLGTGARYAALPQYRSSAVRLQAPKDFIIWVHAVSVGETRAAQPLIEQLAQARPDARFILTHMTPTGRAVGAELVAALPGRALQRYLPYDTPGAMRRFLAQTRPSLGLLMETEVWPNLMAAATDAGVPVALVNARLSERSLAKALRWPRLMREASSRLAGVAAQSDQDAVRLQQLFAGPMPVFGNLKFDQIPPDSLLARGRLLRITLGVARLWLFASTREGEETLILDALAPLMQDRATAPCVLIVPRHPQRFNQVAQQIEAAGHPLIRRSDPGWGAPPTAGAVLLGDSMGELPLYYAMSDMAVVGGSLMPLGGQNLIEACSCGCPVIVGPHTFNFAQATADALAAGAALRVADATAAVAELQALSNDLQRRTSMCLAAYAFAIAHRGATGRTVNWALALTEKS